MKFLSSYAKEMKIAARGFYFYIEIFFAVIILIILLVAVKEESVSKTNEFIYYDMSPAAKEYLINKDIEKGTTKKIESTEFKLKPVTFSVMNVETKEIMNYDYDQTILNLDTYEEYERDTGKLAMTFYATQNEEDTIRLSFAERKIGAAIVMNDIGEMSYRYYNQGYETGKLINLLYVFHNESPEALRGAYDSQNVTKLNQVQTLNDREIVVPIMVAFMGSLMGFFIVMAYIYLDKAEGVIRAFAVSPSPVWQYLLSKILVILSTAIVSSSIITIPVMGLQPNYLLFYLLLIISTFAFAALGLFVASFFDSISQAFGALYIIMIVMIIPSFSYLIPSFDPIWLRFFPTYPLLQGFKEIIMTKPDVPYVLTCSLAFFIGGALIFMLANHRFKKTLTM